MKKPSVKKSVPSSKKAPKKPKAVSTPSTVSPETTKAIIAAVPAHIDLSALGQSWNEEIKHLAEVVNAVISHLHSKK